MWGVLDQLERTRRKEKKKGEVAKKVYSDSVQLIFIAYTNKSYPITTNTLLVLKAKDFLI